MLDGSTGGFDIITFNEVRQTILSTSSLEQGVAGRASSSGDLGDGCLEIGRHRASGGQACNQRSVYSLWGDSE